VAIPEPTRARRARKAVRDDQPGEAGPDDERPGADARQQSQRVADELQELRAPEVRPHLLRRLGQRDEDDETRDREHRRDPDGGDDPG